MQLSLVRVIAIVLAALATGCSSNSGLLSSAASNRPLSPEEEAQEDQKCQSSGYQINTPAYEYCRGELARQRTIADNYQPVPPIRGAR
jgi:hypothetical protein